MRFGRSPRYLALALFTLAAASSCDDDAETPAPPTQQAVGPEGGTVSSGGAEIAVPAGALSDEVTIEVGAVDEPLALPDNLTRVGSVFSFTPHGQTFAIPVTIELPYTGDRAGLRVLVLDDPADTEWDTVSGVTFEDGVASFQVEHLCFFAVTRVASSVEAVVYTLTIPDGEPNAVTVNGDHDLVVFDANIDNDYGVPHLRFFEVTVDDELDAPVFELSEDELTIDWTTGIRVGWMAYDRYHDLLYVLADRGRTTDAGLHWDQMQVHVVSGRAQVGWFNYNPDGGRPIGAPVDFRISVAGFAMKEAHSEGDNPTRLFVHDIVGGNLEVLELDESGTALAWQERFSYRDRLDEGCDWPDVDPEPWRCNWLGTIGNTLALEWQLESQSSGEPAGRDHLYLTDHNYSGVDIRVLSIAESGPVDLQFLPDVDMTEAHDVLVNGIEGLAMAGTADTLYVATGLQAFEEGYLGTVDTATRTPGVIVIPYSDKGDVLVDPSNPDRVFVAVSDSFAEGTPLLVHVIEGGSVVSTYRILESYDERVHDMAYDPELGLLYVVTTGQILAVEID